MLETFKGLRPGKDAEYCGPKNNRMFIVVGFPDARTQEGIIMRQHGWLPENRQGSQKSKDAGSMARMLCERKHGR